MEFLSFDDLIPEASAIYDIYVVESSRRTRSTRSGVQGAVNLRLDGYAALAAKYGNNLGLIFHGEHQPCPHRTERNAIVLVNQDKHDEPLIFTGPHRFQDLERWVAQHYGHLV